VLVANPHLLVDNRSGPSGRPGAMYSTATDEAEGYETVDRSGLAAAVRLADA
jgi:hypothetical protein